jgi:hypothetical protein
VKGAAGRFDVLNGREEGVKWAGADAIREEPKLDDREVAGMQEMRMRRLLTIRVMILREDSRREIGQELDRDSGPGLG